MNKLLKIFLFFFLSSSILLNADAAFWNKKEKKEKDIVEPKKLFKEDNVLKQEFNSNITIQLKSKPLKDSFINNLTNNNGRLDYSGKLEKVSKFKFSSIDNFNQLEPEIIFDDYGIIFFDNKGNILKFNDSSKLIWKKNFYKKKDKKLKPKLSFGNNEKILIVADSLANYYAINIENGELVWLKKNSSPFNSQIKVYKNKFFVVDFENILRCYSIKDGKELWRVRTDQSFIKSQKKLSLVVVENKVFFNNSIGDITSVNIDNGNLEWQTPTQSNLIYEDTFFLKTSDLITDNKSILFSNNRNEFFSLDVNQGELNWKQKINSNLRSTLVENLIFTVSLEGYLVITDNRTGNIIRITDIFDQFKNRKRFFKAKKNESKPEGKLSKLFLSSKYSEKKPKKKRKKSKFMPTSKYSKDRTDASNVEPVGFILGKKNIYLTTDNGKLLIIDIRTGKTNSIIKIDNNKVSRPFVLNKSLFLIKDNSIMKLN